MLYAVFMSSSPPHLPASHGPSGEPELLEIGFAADGGCSGPGLRADAARNRARLMEAAGKLVAEHGPAGVTMEAVAAAACVGKGTVFRRFGDRNGLLTALLDHTAKQLQADLMSGPPPLGPGAPADERLRAFGVEVLRRSAEQLELQLAAQPEPERRIEHPSRRVLATHVTILLRELLPGADCVLQAQALMGYLDPALIHYLTKRCEMPLERLEAGWTDLVSRITGTGA
ncbi:TetR/AcrR family transcriptional regulator [Streptomyces kunmingensis]|uniref:TetR/AcrR family transcriptional regulator n=1 Tax=Streptomyces kunmingensis TaxID=68225 RepID=A0ABU6CQ42_9ACTN|nr:TetR/AcrR family transcriptional regulator [Streptomyces kunmingensis]MEB3966866.1 TetR/AcrR family transcriptional regulator [Streptomyces kunmingensis]